MSTAYLVDLLCDEATSPDCRRAYRFIAARPDGAEEAVRRAGNRGWMRTLRKGDPFDSYDCCPACRVALNRATPGG
jgi:hypothetical protein